MSFNSIFKINITLLINWVPFLLMEVLSLSVFQYKTVSLAFESHINNYLKHFAIIIIYLSFLLIKALSVSLCYSIVQWVMISNLI